MTRKTLALVLALTSVSACAQIWGFEAPGGPPPEAPDAGVDGSVLGVDAADSSKNDTTTQDSGPGSDAADVSVHEAEADSQVASDSSMAVESSSPDALADAPSDSQALDEAQDTGLADTLVPDSADGSSSAPDAPDTAIGDSGSGEGGMDSTLPHDSGADTMSVDSSIGDAGLPTVCTAAAVDPTQVFVVSSGSDDSACGSQSQPCGSVQVGVMQAHMNGATTVYVGTGTYTDSVTLAAGITIVGGWNVVNSTWTKDPAVGTANRDVILAPVMPANITVTATNLGGEATLCTLTLSSAMAAEPGQTLYGVFASSTNASTPTTVTLDDVAITIAAGGDGIMGTSAGQATGASGTCATPGDGNMGSMGPPATPGPAGTFMASGYVPGNGGTGGTGATGHNGTPGGSGTCVSGLNCSAPLLICNSSTTPDASCGTAGSPGCGGNGGNGGTGGSGGGSSIGVYAYNATINATQTTVMTMNGGTGAPGGMGGPGGSGSSGTAGSPGISVGAGTCNSKCAPTSQTAGVAGPTGGTGGMGGTGAVGGPGSGGWSCGFAQVGTAMLNRGLGVSVTVKAPGSGGGTGAAGGKAQQLCP